MPGFDPNEPRDPLGRWTDEIGGAIQRAASDKKYLSDENGEPIVFYHGTKVKFDVFDKEKIGSNLGNYSFGFHFSDDPYNPKITYAGESGYLVRAHLIMKNPLVIDATPGYGAETYLDERRNEIISQIVESRRNKKPYDGVIVNGTTQSGAKQRSVVVFEPNQIKIIK